MEKFRYTKEGEDKCRQGIGWKKSCYKCLYDTLCLFQYNQERIERNSKKDLAKEKERGKTEKK